MRKCSRCKQIKTIEEFNFKEKTKGIRQYQCKSCSRLYVKQHYENNKAYYLSKARKRNNKIREEIKRHTWNYLKTHPCVDCGEKDPVVLEFDHISDKIINVSNMYRNFTLERVVQEIAKCQVRCANCHRRKTAIQFGWYKKLMPL